MLFIRYCGSQFGNSGFVSDRTCGRLQFGQAEVENLPMTRICDENICGLDVSMNNSLAVSRVERVSNLDSQVEHLFQRNGLACDAVFQGLAFQKLHGDEGRAVLLVNLVDGANVGMIQGRSSLRLAVKTSQSLRVFGDLLRQKFQGDEARRRVSSAL